MVKLPPTESTARASFASSSASFAAGMRWWPPDVGTWSRQVSQLTVVCQSRRTDSGSPKALLSRMPARAASRKRSLVELVLDHLARLAAAGERLRACVGQGTVSRNATEAMTDAFTPAALAVVSLVLSRDGLRTRLRANTPHGIPLLTELAAALTGYLRDEAARGRLVPTADPAALALNLVGTGHLLFAGELGAMPDRTAVYEVVSTILVGAERPSSSDH